MTFLSGAVQIRPRLHDETLVISGMDIRCLGSAVQLNLAAQLEDKLRIVDSFQAGRRVERSV